METSPNEVNLIAPMSDLISFKVHLHYMKANVKAISSLIFVVAKCEH